MATSVVHQATEDSTHLSMMAWCVLEFGPPDVMRFERVLRPNPGPSNVLVKVEAAGSAHGTSGLGPEERLAATTPPHSRLGSVW
jgi:hypothetical protein